MKQSVTQAPTAMLKQTHRFCNGNRLEYALFGYGEGEWDRFRVLVKGFGEARACDFAMELSSALQLFDRLVEGMVPPCVLREIVFDQMERMQQA